MHAGTVLGIVISLLLLYVLGARWSGTLYFWEDDPTSWAIGAVQARVQATNTDVFVVGSSQSQQLQPAFMEDLTGLRFMIACRTAGDIPHMLAMSRAIADWTPEPPVILAEFSRFVALRIAQQPFRSVTRYFPLEYWAAGEAPFALPRPAFREFYWEGMRCSLLPLVRFQMGVRAICIDANSNAASYLLHRSSYPPRLSPIHLPEDNHQPPFNYQPGPYHVPVNLQAASLNPESHKLGEWLELLDLHRRGRIRLVLLKPPYHADFAPFYRRVKEPVTQLEQTLASNGVPVIDCSVIAFNPRDYHDAHHFTESGVRKYSSFVASNMVAILGRQHGNARYVHRLVSDTPASYSTNMLYVSVVPRAARGPAWNPGHTHATLSLSEFSGDLLRTGLPPDRAILVLNPSATLAQHLKREFGFRAFALPGSGYCVVRKSFIPFRDEVQQYRLSLLHSDVTAASNAVARARSQAESIAARHRLSDTLAACSNWTAAAYILEPVYWLTTNGSVAACQGTALRLAELNMAGADFAAAAEWYARAPVQNYATVYGQAQAWMSANMPDRAVEFYTRACVLRPGLVTPLLELALAQDVLGDADAVDATCTRIRDLLARIPASRRQRAMALPEYRRLKERVGERLPE